MPSGHITAWTYRLLTIFIDVTYPQAYSQVDPRIAKIGFAAVKRANELTDNKRPDYLDSLAFAYFQTGNMKDAVATEERAIEMMRTTASGASNADLNTYNEHLSDYRKASEDRKQHVGGK